MQFYCTATRMIRHFEILKIQMGIPPISPFSLDAPKTTLVRNANGAIAGFSTWFLSRYVSNSFLAYLNSENMTWPLHQPASANGRAFVSTWKEATANEKRPNCAGGSTDFFEKKDDFASLSHIVFLFLVNGRNKCHCHPHVIGTLMS